MYNVKLGKTKVRQDHRTMMMARYMSTLVWPTLLPAESWGSGVASWGMMDNDKYGDCTCAGAGHLIMSWNAANGRIITPDDADIVAAYSAITGFDPNDPSTDNGANELDVLNYWRKTGIAGHQIGGYAGLSWMARLQTMLAVHLFGGAYIGLDLPLYAQGKPQWDAPQSLDGPGAVGSWGGHAVPIIGYDPDYLTVITWGAPLKMSWDFYQTYCEEAYAIFSMDFITGTQSPDGFDLATLQSDLNQINQAA